MSILIRLIILCFSLHMVSTQPPSEFWIKAEKTLVLDEMRVQSNLQAPKVDDVVISMPSFLPLCGNGRIDTKNDYIAYYQNAANLPLRLTRKQITFDKFSVSDPDILHDVKVFADEQCDDGNRVDFDGCSADCMYLDVWTSACELAVDINLLVYEDIMYDTVRKSMVVSATTGIYLFEPGDTSLKAQLLAPKTLPVSNIFRYAGSLILYSAVEQAFWKLLDGQSEITLMRTIPQLAKWDPLYFKWDCRVSPSGSIIVQDNYNLLYLATPNVDIGFVCPIGRRIDKCTFIDYTSTGDISRFRCESATELLGVVTQVGIGAGYCSIYTDPVYPSHSIWGDLFNLVSISSIMERGTNQYIQVSPAIPGVSLSEYPVSLNVFLPMGGFLQGTGSSARSFGASKLSRDIFYFTGDPSLVRLIMDQNRTCSQERCAFDNYNGYDAFDLNPVNPGSKSSWNDILQQCISTEAAISPPLSDLKAIKADSQRYTRLLLSFATIYRTETRALEVTGMDEHPITHNIWAVRKDRIIEVSKSGVLVQREDGKCIPSGVALCPLCEWAPNGQKCKSCSVVDKGSLAWILKCKDSCLPSSGRRLLAANTVIQFVLSGNFATVAKIWPVAVSMPNGVITVEISTQDPVAEMKRIQTSLLALTGVEVLTRPYVVIPVAVPSSSSDDTTGVVVGVLVPVVLLLVVGVCVYVFWLGPRAKLAAERKKASDTTETSPLMPGIAPEDVEMYSGQTKQP